MPVSLLRHHDFSRACTLEPGTGEVRRISRHLSSDAPARWLPELPVNGYFDDLGGMFVALYRDPTWPEDLWLNIGGGRWRVSEDLTSWFSPEIGNGEPELANADVTRAFRLLNHGNVVLEHRYALHDRERRLRGGMDPFPNWPDEEENYDLLFFVHQILQTGRWRRVLMPPPRE